MSPPAPEPSRTPAGSGAEALPGRLEARWRERRWTGPGDRVIVACSGGLDSLALLHLLRFSLPSLGLDVSAAHFDHRMRPESGADAAWLEGVAGAWGIPLHHGRAASAPRSEARARELRYAFLENVARTLGSGRILTAHHADDQIETVLFRILRGTGMHGLRGIPESREPGILRPLLGVHRSELEAYARQHRLRPRPDATNRSRRHARNRVRHELLPLMEEIHPGARSGLLRLARNAEAAGAALHALLAPVLDRLVLERSRDRVVLERSRLLDLEAPILAELLRQVAASLGPVPSESGTAVALQFISRGSSGGEVWLAGGLRVSRKLDTIVVERVPEAARGRSTTPFRTGGAAAAEAVLVIPSPEPGEGELAVADRRYRVVWGARIPAREDDPGGSPPEPAGRRGTDPGDAAGLREASFGVPELRFPLSFRGWRPGDRTRTRGGRKKLKKLFGELRIPDDERHRLPLLVDAEDQVVWIPGVHRAPRPDRAAGTEADWRVGVVGTDER